MARLLTFFVSAIWHGFYGGYYFTFFTFFLLAHLSTLTYKLSKYTSNPLIALYNNSGWIGQIGVILILNYYFGQSGVTFIVLSLPISWRLLSSIYFAPQIVLVLGIVGSMWMLRREKRR